MGRFWLAGRRDLHWHILPTPETAAFFAPYTGGPSLRARGAGGLGFRARGDCLFVATLSCPGLSRDRTAVVDRGCSSYGSDRGAEREAW